MLLNLIETLKSMELHFELITLRRVDIPFSDFTATIVISDDMIYKVFIVSKDGELEDMELCKTPKEVVDYITWYDCQLIWG